MGEDRPDVHGGDGQQDRIGIEADNAENEEYDDVTQREIDRIGDTAMGSIVHSSFMMLSVIVPAAPPDITPATASVP